MGKEMKIDGCVLVPESETEDTFYDKFVDWVISNGWTFGGGIEDITDKDIDLR